MSMTFDAWLTAAAESRRKAGLERRLTVMTTESDLTDLAGNDYLGLTHHPRVVAAAGGVSDRGLSGRVTVFRRDATRNERIVDVDLDRVLSGKAEDPELSPFDIVDVPLRGDPKRTQPPVIGPEDAPIRRESLPLRVIN